MTRGPRATLGTPIDVAMPRPRTAALLVHDKEAMRVRTHVIESLTAPINRGIRLQPDLTSSGIRLQPDSEARPRIRLKADPTNAARNEA
jgi:hypothetical protein